MGDLYADGARTSKFKEEVRVLATTIGLASKAERLKLINRAVRQQIVMDGKIVTSKDVLDWLKLAKDETAASQTAINLNIPGWDEMLELVYGKGRESNSPDDTSA